MGTGEIIRSEAARVEHGPRDPPPARRGLAAPALPAHAGAENPDYESAFPAIETGESRAQPGRGIRETYLSFGLSNTDGQEFRLDNIEVEETTSTTRRV